MEKYVVYKRHELEKPEVYKSFEDKSFYNKKISIFKLIIACLFEKGFFWKLTETIKYALIHSECYRGLNVSDVLLFKNTENFNKIWIKEKSSKNIV